MSFLADHTQSAVVRTKIVTGLCWKRSCGKWIEGSVLLQYTTEDEYAHLDIGYMFTPLTLRQTLCGEIIKGVKVKKIDSKNVKYEHNDDFESMMRENVGNLWEMTDEFVVIKVDRRQSMQRLHDTHSTVTNPENPWKEVAALQLLGNTHPNVINLLGAFIDDRCLYEVMPYCSGDSLSTFIRSHPNGISVTQARHIFVQLLLGLHHIHSHGVCHHDISLSNIMFDEDGSNCIIIDFGMSLRVPHSYMDDPSGATDDVTDESMGTTRRLIHSNNHCGKLRFMAPEIYQREYAFDGLAVDIWSAGVVLFALITGKQPYERPDANKDSGYYDLIDDGFYWDTHKVDPLLSWGHEVSFELVDLLKKMLNPNPRERATLSQILNHRWLYASDRDCYERK